jgi:flagellar assembly protein FliH
VILRDAIFSAERRHLGAQPAPAVQPVEPTVRLDEGVREKGSIYEPRTPEPPPLSADRVANWIVAQDGATRISLASLLSDDLTALRESARREGYESGHQEAMTEARDKVGSALAALEKLNLSAASAFDSECTRVEIACAEIVSQAFFKLAGEALVSRAAIVGTVNEVLKRVRDERELRIHVNPADLPVLRSAEQGIAACLPGRSLSLVADGRVECGGCIVESALGSLDGRLEVQLAELCATLRAAKSGGSE